MNISSSRQISEEKFQTEMKILLIYKNITRGGKEENPEFHSAVSFIKLFSLAKCIFT